MLTKDGTFERDDNDPINLNNGLNSSSKRLPISTNSDQQENEENSSSVYSMNRKIEAMDDAIGLLANKRKDEVAATIKNVLERGWDATLMKDRLERFSANRKQDINDYCSQHYTEFLEAAQKLLYTNKSSTQLQPILKEVQKGMIYAALTSAKEGLELDALYQIRKELATSIFFIQNCCELTSKIEVVERELQTHDHQSNSNRQAVLDPSKYVMILDVLEQIETDINVLIMASNIQNHNDNNKNKADVSTESKRRGSNISRTTKEEYNYTTTFVSVIQDFLPKLYRKLKDSALAALYQWLVRIRDRHVEVGRAGLRKAFGYMTGLGVDSDDLNTYTDKASSLLKNKDQDTRKEMKINKKTVLLNTSQQILYQMNTVVPWKEWSTEAILTTNIPYFYTVKDSKSLEADQKTLATLTEAMADLHRCLYIHGRLNALDEHFTYYKCNRLPQARTETIVQYHLDFSDDESDLSSSDNPHMGGNTNSSNENISSLSPGLPSAIPEDDSGSGNIPPVIEAPLKDGKASSKLASFFSIKSPRWGKTNNTPQPSTWSSTNSALKASKLLGTSLPTSITKKSKDVSTSTSAIKDNKYSEVKRSAELIRQESFSIKESKLSRIFVGCPPLLIKFHDRITYIAGYFVTEYVILHTCPMRYRGGILSTNYLESEWTRCTRELTEDIEKLVSAEEQRCIKMENNLAEAKTKQQIKERYNPDLFSDDSETRTNMPMYSNTLSRSILHIKLLVTNLCFLFGDDTFFFQTDLLLQSVILLSDRLAYAIVQESKIETHNVLYDAVYQPLTLTNEKELESYITAYGLHNINMQKFGEIDEDEEISDLQPEVNIQRSRTRRNSMVSKRSTIMTLNGKRRTIIYPKVYPFSLVVPRLCRILHMAIFKFFLFALHIRMPKFDELLVDLLKDCLENIVSTIDNEVSFESTDEDYIANFPISKACQIAIDVEIFSLSLSMIEMVVAQGLLRFNLSESISQETRSSLQINSGRKGNDIARTSDDHGSMTETLSNKSLTKFHETVQYFQKSFRKVSEKAESIIYELVQSKIADLLSSGLCFVQWDSTEPNTRPNSYVDDLITYLQVTFNGLRNMRKEARFVVYFTSCNWIKELLTTNLFKSPQDQNGSPRDGNNPSGKFLSFGSPFKGLNKSSQQKQVTKIEQEENNSIREITTIGLYNFSIDIAELERFADSTGEPDLRKCFTELRQTINLFLDKNLEVLLRDEDLRLESYPQTDMNKIISILEKYKPNTQGIMASYGKKANYKVDISHLPQLDKKTVAKLIKDLHESGY